MTFLLNPHLIALAVAFGFAVWFYWLRDATPETLRGSTPADIATYVQTSLDKINRK